MTTVEDVDLTVGSACDYKVSWVCLGKFARIYVSREDIKDDAVIDHVQELRRIMKETRGVELVDVDIY